MTIATAAASHAHHEVHHEGVPLQGRVTETVQYMLTHLEHGANISNVYREFLEQVEIPLLRAVMVHTKNNQVRAAKLLGISRGTLRTKLKKYFGNEYCETRGK